MKKLLRSHLWHYMLGLLLIGLFVVSCQQGNDDDDDSSSNSNTDTTMVDDSDDTIAQNAQKLVEEGRQIFRFDTFGDEVFWSETLKLHEAIAGSEFGGIGEGLSASAALSVGLKVDVTALPESLQQQLAAGEVDLEATATTMALLQLNAVVGVQGQFDDTGNLSSVGLTCAVCHSTVDDSFADGIGYRLDGWPNRDLNVGAIIALSPDLSVPSGRLGVSEEALKSVLNGWGVGKFDAAVFIDGKASVGPTLIPPAFGLAGVNLATHTGWGSVTYWNAFVANLEMGGQGTFFDTRLNDNLRFPVAAANNLGDVRSSQDLITSKLAALHFYQLAIPAPEPSAGSFDATSASRGQALFNEKAGCASCHVPPLFTEPGYNLHTAEEIGIDDEQAQRSPAQGYRTTPLKGLWSHTKGGFYHDGRFAMLADVVDHYDNHFALGLTDQEKSDLEQYLLSL